MLTSLRDFEKSLRNPLANTIPPEAVATSNMAESRASHSHVQSPPRAFNAGTESSMLNSAFLNSQSSVIPRSSFVQPRIVQGTFLSLYHLLFRSQRTSAGNVHECTFRKPSVDGRTNPTKSGLWVFWLWNDCPSDTTCTATRFEFKSAASTSGSYIQLPAKHRTDGSREYRRQSKRYRQ